MVSIEFICADRNTSFSSFMGGETITGTIVVKFKRQMTVKGIEAHLVGKSSFAVKIYRTVYYRREHYLSTDLQFLRDPSGLDVIVKPEPDSYSYPFLFTLPPNIPQSFKGKKGSVEYSLIVIVKRGIFKRNIKKTFTLNVNAVLNLNLVALTRFSPNTMNSVAIYSDEDMLLNNVEHINEDIFVNSMKFPRKVTVESHDMKLVFMVTQTGVVPGENIKFNAFIGNTSRISIRSKFQIFQEVKYNYAVDQSSWLDSMAKEYKTVFKLDGPTIGPRSTAEWNIKDASVKLPAIPPTNLGGGSLINVNYCAQLILKSYGVFQLTGSIPITIGTIPLSIGPQEAQHVLRIESETFESHWKAVTLKRCLTLLLLLFIFILAVVIFAIVRVGQVKGNSD